MLIDAQTANSSYRLHDITEVLLKPMDRIDKRTFYGRCFAFVMLALWSWLLFTSDFRNGEIGASFMHNILLPIHETGHVLFMPFGNYMSILGGSLFQLLLPLGVGIALFWITKENFGAAIGIWWTDVSLIDLATYIYDARHPQLILLGGHTGDDGHHDWIYLLRVLGQPDEAQGWGTLVHTLGGMLMLVALFWVMSATQGVYLIDMGSPIISTYGNGCCNRALSDPVANMPVNGITHEIGISNGFLFISG